jgi:hypothetical protein
VTQDLATDFKKQAGVDQGVTQTWGGAYGLLTPRDLDLGLWPGNVRMEA